MYYWIYWIYGTDLFDGKEFAIDGATQIMYSDTNDTNDSNTYVYTYTLYSI